jgi:hypothetical protein
MGDISPNKAWSRIMVSCMQFIVIFITFNVVVEQNTSITKAFKTKCTMGVYSSKKN